MPKSRGLSFIIIALVSAAVLFIGSSMMDSGGGSFADIADGVYEGTSDAGMHPGLKVAVTFEGGSITNVEFVEHGETEGISDPAIEGVPAAIVEASSTMVDAVSGATYTSDAIKEAVSLALEGAVAEGETEAPAEPAEAGSYADGTYEGVSDAGMYEGLKVAATVEGGV